MAERTVFSRREALIVSGAAAYAATVGTARAADAGERFGGQPGLSARQRLLLRGGTIISMDPRVGDLARGDVLIEGAKISARRAEHCRGRARRSSTPQT